MSAAYDVPATAPGDRTLVISPIIRETIRYMVQQEVWRLDSVAEQCRLYDVPPAAEVIDRASALGILLAELVR